MAKSRTERIADLQSKQQQLQARLQSLQQAEKSEARKREDKKRILIGACIMKRIELGHMTQEDVNKWMDDFLTRPYERELFGLAVKGSE